MSRKTLLIGCGGSGITTLMRFNEMLAANRQWRDRLWEEVSYLVVDTEVDMANSFRKAVDSQLGRAKKPLIRLAQITRGYEQLGEIISPNFEAEEVAENVPLLRPFWWFSPDGEPYRAHRRRHIGKGAGQCGPISYMTAWNYLPDFEKDLDGLFADIRRHNIGEDAPLSDLRVYIVAGMAGGTGRGCWNLIAFKVRQYLKRRFNRDIAPIAVFFDVSCFPNSDIHKDPAQVHSMSVNSLTAYSELDAWIKLANNNRGYYFRLPELSDPAEVDVLKVDPKHRPFDSSEKAPVEAAYLVFGDNGRGTLRSNEEYHEMAAASLYAMVVGARYIDPGEINRVHDYASLASSSFEVETVKLRSYFESMVREKVIDDISDAKDKALAADADRLLGVGAANDGSFFYRNGFEFAEELNPQSIMPVEDLAGASILQRIVGKVLKFRPNAEAGFKAAVKRQDVKGGWEFAHKLLMQVRGGPLNVDVSQSIPDSEIVRVVDEAFAEVGLGDVRMALCNLMTQVYAPDDRSCKPSVGRVLVAAKRLADDPDVSNGINGLFNKSKKNLLAGVRNGRFAYEKQKDIVTHFKSIYDAAAKKKFFEFRPFNKSDLEIIGRSFSWHLQLAVYFRVRELIARKFDEAIAATNQIAYAVSLVKESLDAVSRTFHKQAKVFCAEGVGSAYDALFVRPDLEAVRADLPDADETTPIYRRVLKPIMSEDEIARLIVMSGKDRTVEVDEKSIKKALSGEIVRLIESADRINPRDEVSQLKVKFADLFKSGVLMERDFMSVNFSFDKVLRTNVVWWNKLLSATIGDPDGFDRLVDRFRTYLGIDKDILFSEDSDSARPEIPVDKLVKCILVSLVGTCKPWVQLRDLKHGDYCLTLALVPMDLGNVAEYEKAIGEAHPTQLPKLIHRGSASKGGYELPGDRIVVFASQGIPCKVNGASALDRISSLDYWKTDSAVKKSLQLAESQDGMSYFERDPDGDGYKERDIGLGFVSPVFVADGDLRELRWKPWAPKETVSEARKREVELCKSLLYAFLGNGLKVENDDIGGLVSEYGWTLPLLKMGGIRTEDFTFTRMPLDWKAATSKSGKTGGRCAARRSWTEGELLATSIDNVFAFLSGKGRPGEEGSKLEASVKKGREIFAQLSQERQTFEKNVRSELNSAQVEKLVEGLQDWLDVQKRKASKTDTPYWEKLIDALSAE